MNEHADEEARFDIFDRINTGSKVANRAEVRRGALGGPFLDLVIELAKDPLFAKLAPISKQQIGLRKNEELVTRFFAYGDGLDGYKDRVFAFLYAYTKRKNAEFIANPSCADDYRGRFMRTMQFVDQNFSHGFRKAPKATTTPSARFEAIAVGSYLALEKKPSLANAKIDVTPWVESEEFKGVAGSGSANVVKKLRGRLHFVRDKLLGT